MSTYLGKLKNWGSNPIIQLVIVLVLLPFISILAEIIFDLGRAVGTLARMI